MTPKDFEANVMSLLRLGGYDVKPETLVGYKKVDVYAEERRWQKPRRIAVECKLYERPLTQAHVNEIYTNYRPLYDANQIDDILLVTMNGVAPSADAFIGTARGFAHLSLLDLQNSIIDFSGYLLALTKQVADDGLESYYVRPQVAGKRDLEELALQWILDASQPLAILGSYGMGKTSFARHLAAELARRAVADPHARIPILIRLAEISAEQSLEGLLGRVLASANHVRHYNFEAFMELNRRGRLVIFLDGFDEMKHALTWDQFRYNFKELNRLVVPESRVVLLGRPTAFLSDAEHQYVLHGIRRGSELREAGWPDYQEIHLQPFSREQVRQFLIGYARYLAESGKVPTADAPSILQRIYELPPAKLTDLATRPVQLRILAEVLPQWRGSVGDLTLAKLYSVFINMVIEREQEKVTRRRFDVRERRDFARALAFWLWTTRATAMSVDAEHIPSALFPPPKGDDVAEGVRRDMVSACFLDRKLGDTLFFPHRSFQEFLVAEHVLLQVRQLNIDFRVLSDTVTPEISEFVGQLAEPDDFEKFNGLLRRSTGEISLPLALAWVRSSEIAESVMKALRTVDNNPWGIVLGAVSVIANTTLTSAEEFLEILVRRAPEFQPRTRLAALLSAMAVVDSAPRDVVSDAFLKFLIAVAEAASADFVRSRRLTLRRAVRYDAFIDSDFVEANVLRSIEILGREQYPEVTFDLRRAYAMLVRELKNEVLIGEWSDAARAAQAESLARLRVPVRLTRNTLKESDVAGDASFLRAMSARLPH